MRGVARLVDRPSLQPERAQERSRLELAHRRCDLCRHARRGSACAVRYSARRARVLAGPGRRTRALVLRLERTARAHGRGRVLDLPGDDGAPAAAARVASAPRLAHARSGDRGRARAARPADRHRAPVGQPRRMAGARRGRARPRRVGASRGCTRADAARRRRRRRVRGPVCRCHARSRPRRVSAADHGRGHAAARPTARHLARTPRTTWARGRGSATATGG